MSKRKYLYLIYTWHINKHDINKSQELKVGTFYTP